MRSPCAGSPSAASSATVHRVARARRSSWPTANVVLPIALVTFSSVFANHSFAAVVRSRRNVSTVQVDGSARVANVSALNLDRLESNGGKLENSKKRGKKKEADDLIHGDVTQLRGPRFRMLYIRRTKEPHTKCRLGLRKGGLYVNGFLRLFFTCRRRDKASVICLSN